MIRIESLRKTFSELNLGGFLLSSSDEFNNEYVPPCLQRLKWLTGFTGSNGVAIILKNKAAFFTDGRYTLQASKELDTKTFKIFDMADQAISTWIKDNLPKGKKIGFYSMAHTVREISKIKDYTKPTKNLIDQLWKDRPKKKLSDIYTLPLNLTGQKSNDKIKLITKQMKLYKTLLLTDSESICWLLNMRASDIDTVPIALSYAILYDNKKLDLFVDTDKLPRDIAKIATTYPTKEIENKLKSIKDVIGYDPSSASVGLVSAIRDGKEIQNPCLLPKACKTNQEINAHRAAQIDDGIALCRYMHWLQENHKKQKIDEFTGEERLLEFRKESKRFITPSFNTISAFGANGAIVHYKTDPAKAAQITDKNLYLFDSGGQYDGATTDVTRTVALGKPTKEQCRNYTLVLKGHVTLARAIFPKRATGADLDALARFALWQDLKDYNHGTGHGVGSFMNVHEGPQGISRACNQTKLEPGMILSNEPGFYLANKYGIRIENLILVEKKSDNFLGFETLTLAPYDKKLIDTSLLSTDEVNWINQYHKMVWNKLSSKLPKEVKAWLKNAATPL